MNLVSKSVSLEEALVMINKFIQSSAFGEATQKEKELLIKIKKSLKEQINKNN